MPKIKYLDINIQTAGRALIDRINAVVSEYRQAGYSLTLRQVYYQTEPLPAHRYFGGTL